MTRAMPSSFLVPWPPPYRAQHLHPWTWVPCSHNHVGCHLCYLIDTVNQSQCLKPSDVCSCSRAVPGNLTCLSSQTVVSCIAFSLPWHSEHIWFSRTATIRNGHPKVLLHLLKGNALPAPISFPVSSLLSVWQQQGSTGSHDDTEFCL